MTTMSTEKPVLKLTKTMTVTVAYGAIIIGTRSTRDRMRLEDWRTKGWVTLMDNPEAETYPFHQYKLSDELALSLRFTGSCTLTGL